MQPIEDRDGVPLRKNLDAWLSNHSGDRRKALSLTSLAAHRQWCCYGSFNQNFAVVAKFAERELEKGLREGKAGKQGSKALDAAVSKQLPPLLRMIHALAQHVELIAVPISHRYVELELDPEADIKDVHALLKNAIGKLDKDFTKANLIFEMLQKGNKFACLQGGSARALAASSPLHRATPEAEEASAQADVAPTPTIARQLAFQDEATAPEPVPAPDKGGALAETESMDKKRQRLPNVLFDPSPVVPSDAKKAKSEHKSESERRGYNKSGLYSKDPLKAAMAREKLGIKAPKKSTKTDGKKVKLPDALAGAHARPHLKIGVEFEF